MGEGRRCRLGLAPPLVRLTGLMSRPQVQVWSVSTRGLTSKPLPQKASIQGAAVHPIRWLAGDWAARIAA